MYRFIEEKLVSWKKNQERKPLILQGARQVGKTFILKEFGEKHFRKYHHIDFEFYKKEIEAIVETTLDPEKIIKELQILIKKDIDLHNDLVIFDEIQAVERALTAIKYFKESGYVSFLCCARSNLGIKTANISFPVGSVSTIELYPMNFLEFLLASGEVKLYDRLVNIKSIKDGINFGPIAHKQVMDIMKDFLAIGGMPEVVSNYLAISNTPNKAYEKVCEIRNELLNNYEKDFAKYAGATNSRHIERIYNNIPQQLAREINGKAPKYKFKDVLGKGNRGFEIFSDPIMWLKNSGLIYILPIVEHAIYPVLSHCQDSVFKLFINDVGLLAERLKISPHSVRSYTFGRGNFKGFFIENYVVSELLSYDISPLVSWKRKTSEIEFITEINEASVPIEVKSGENTKSKSLMVFREKYKPEMSIKITGKPFGIDKINNIINIPLYACSSMGDILKSFSVESN